MATNGSALKTIYSMIEECCSKMRKKVYDSPEFELVKIMITSDLCTASENPEGPVHEIGDDDIINN